MVKSTRRNFLQASALTAAGLGAELYSVPAKASPADKVSVALIGAGGRGTMLMQGFCKRPDVHVEYICDPEDARAARTADIVSKAQGSMPKTVRDMRKVLDDKSVDAVIIATPEHWHALGAIWGCQAGKDVYVEKNASLAIWEGRKMIEASRKYKRHIQVGTQNRSGPYNLKAKEYIQSGKLGKVQLVKVFNLQGGGKWSAQPDSAPPAAFDWELWQGPAKHFPYNAGRHRGWGDYFDYAGGTLSGDGSHQMDLARMVLGDPPIPKAVNCFAGRLMYDDHREIPDIMEISFEFDGMVMTMENGTYTPYMDKIAQDVRDNDLFPNWPQCATRIEIYGSEGLMYLGRHGGGWQVFGRSKTQSRPGELIAQEYGRFPDPWHQADFIECIKTRKKPNADIETAHPSACLTHLANASFRCGNKKLTFDSTAETFGGDTSANQYLKPHYPKGYVLPDRV